MIKEQMNKIYSSKDLDNIPWNVETPPNILQDLISSTKLSPCKIIELGCGAGNYVRYFSKMGFNATGVDISDKAIEMARYWRKKPAPNVNLLKRMFLEICQKLIVNMILSTIGNCFTIYFLKIGISILRTSIDC